MTIELLIELQKSHLPQNNFETDIKEHDKEIPKGKYISPEKRQKIIDNLRLME